MCLQEPPAHHSTGFSTWVCVSWAQDISEQTPAKKSSMFRRVFPHFLLYDCSAWPAGLCPALESCTGVTLASLGWGCRREKGSRIQLLLSLCWLAEGTCSTGVSAALQSALEEDNWIIFLFIRFWTQLQTVAKCFVHVGWVYGEVCLDLTRWVQAALCLPQIIHRQPFQGGVDCSIAFVTACQGVWVPFLLAWGLLSWSKSGFWTFGSLGSFLILAGTVSDGLYLLIDPFC